MFPKRGEPRPKSKAEVEAEKKVAAMSDDQLQDLLASGKEIAGAEYHEIAKRINGMRDQNTREKFLRLLNTEKLDAKSTGVNY